MGLYGGVAETSVSRFGCIAESDSFTSQFKGEGMTMHGSHFLWQFGKSLLGVSGSTSDSQRRVLKMGPWGEIKAANHWAMGLGWERFWA